MTPPTDTLSVLSVAALSLRLALALVLCWAAVQVTWVVVRRNDGSDTKLQRGWFVIGTVIAGTCQWAGALCTVSAIGGAVLPPLAATSGVLLLALTVTGMSLQAATSQPRHQRFLWTGGSAVLLLATVSLWAQAMDWKTSVSLVLAGAVAAALAQSGTVWMLLRWRRGERDASWWRSALMALAPAALALLPLMVVASAAPFPTEHAPGSDLLCALLAGTMAALALQAGRMERHLVGKHQMLGAQLKQATANLQRTPLADPLTGLLSRLGIEAALRKAAVDAEGQGQRIALLAIGLDGFRSVNDSFGHALGDSVLREVARRLVEEAGQMLLPPKVIGHHLARLGGDEFVLMLHGHLDRQGIGRAAGRLLEVLDGTMTCDSHELTLAASIGVACFPEDGGASKLISRANAAMHAAKGAGGSTYMTFEPRMQDEARDRHELLRDLRHAIEHKQLELFYQPKIDARSGQVTAAEALLRWHHPVRGTVAPAQSVDLAEQTGLIIPVGSWVLD
ncbi:MAG TPA: diguanylate cyclase, partial [Albitalea sp.]|nr:diguanylate cyclase [Albitalea sp.]